MGLSLLNSLPDQQTRIDELTRKLRVSEEARVRAESELREERTKTVMVEQGASELRAILTPLYQGLQRIFGEMEVMGTLEAPAASAKPKASAAWDSWKQKLGGLQAKAIDVLLLHGEMNQTQLRIHLSCATRTVSDVVWRLNTAGLINKSGGKISLKEL